MKVYVETNFVLELALEQAQHAECEEILRLAESKSVEIALPAFSFVESAGKLERSHRGRKDLFRKVASEIQQLRRSSTFTEAADAVDASVRSLIAKTIQQERRRLRHLHFRLLNAAHVLPLSAEVFAGVEEVRARFPDLETADAIVLASVLKDLPDRRGNESRPVGVAHGAHPAPGDAVTEAGQVFPLPTRIKKLISEGRRRRIPARRRGARSSPGPWRSRVSS